MGELISKDAFQAANEQGKQELALGPRALSARYEGREDGRIMVELDNGCAFAFPVNQAQGLAGASAEDLAIIEVTPTGLGLHWPLIDADLSIPALLGGVLGSRQWMAQLGQIGGKRRSERKAAAARANGKRGGRPPTTQCGGSVRYIKGASGEKYLSVVVTASNVLGAGILIVEKKPTSSSPIVINASSPNVQLANFDDDPSVDRILYILKSDAVQRREIELDLEAGLTVLD